MKTLKALLLSIFFLSQFINSSFSQTGISNLMRKYKNDSKVTSIKYEGDKFKQFFTNNDTIKTKMEFIDIITFSKNYDITEVDKSKIKALLHKDQFEELINAKSKEGTIKVYAATSKDIIRSLYASFKTNNTIYYVIMKGNIYLEELGTIGSKMNLSQLDFMKNIK